MNEEDAKKKIDAAKRRAELNALDPITYAELEATFEKWMILPDKGVIKLITAFYCANKLPGKALWMFLIGPSGGGKTALLDALLSLPDIEPISLLTPNTFLSGMPGRGDSSLLPKLSNRIALFKDWTTVLSMQKDAKSEIMSQLREIWDGAMKKMFGNGRIAEWTGKVSVLAASTQAVDMNQQQYTHLGERFLNYRMVMPDRKLVAMRSLDNSGSGDQMVKELQNAMYAYIKGLDFSDLTKVATIPDEYKAELVNLSNFCTMARSGIIRDYGMKKEVIFVPTAEMPTRIVGQLAKLASGLSIVGNGQIDDSCMNIIYKTALDSIPQTNRMVIMEMAKANDQTTAEIATALGYPTDPIRIYLENLALLKVCTRIKGGKGNADTWTMHQEFVDIIRKYEKVEALTETEIKVRKEESMDEMDKVFDDF